jgi:predicted DNA-binding protein
MAEKGVQVSATVPKEWDAKLEEHHWKVKKTKTQVVRTAVEQYMQREGLLPYADDEILPEEHGDTA